jgi:hypothetical protein
MREKKRERKERVSERARCTVAVFSLLVGARRRSAVRCGAERSGATAKPGQRSDNSTSLFRAGRAVATIFARTAPRVQEEEAAAAEVVEARRTTSVRQRRPRSYTGQDSSRLVLHMSLFTLNTLRGPEPLTDDVTAETWPTQ